jgi:hypothetical protein
MQRLIRLTTVLALVAAITACGSGGTPPNGAPSVGQARAAEIAGSALAAFNEGDYAGWSRDWDAAMKGAITESDFLAIREQLLASVGRYVSLGTPTLSSKTSGTFRWTFPVTFEKAAGTFWIAFRDGTDDIAGLRFE